MNLPIRKAQFEIGGVSFPCEIIHLPKRAVVPPAGMMLMQPNMTFDTMEEVRKMNPVKIWRDLETGKFCCQIFTREI